MSKQILILGGGYGGLLSALTLREHVSKEEARITLVNKTASHQIITELHRLAAGNIAEKAIALPLEKLLRGKDVELRIDTVQGIDPEAKKVSFGGGVSMSYDILVVALGSETAFFGIPGLQENSLILKSVEDANHIRAHIESRLKEYAKSKNKADATFVVGGGGLTGIELVGELVDTLPETCRKLGVSFQDVSVYCVEAGPSILAGFAPELVDRARTSLEKRGATFLTGLPVTEAKPGVVSLKDGSSIETSTLIWSGGVQGNSVVAECGIEVNRGRATVTPTLQSTSHPEVFLAGDSAVVMSPEGRPYPPTAQLAWQMGETVGANIYAYLRDMPMEEFQPVFSGALASLGRKDAIGTIGASQLKLKGMPASLMKEASNVRYLSHIKGLFTLAY
ncbi:NAD(P)/FAD-dependent oxidoreductase [Paenibacillus senegalensis]|uniref:NAD(P)/FAD-dependent oxidoreductase n=1 Tax=Paenibacillus senegalensis TaxID=1465766 RepID=UPI0002897C35|nr:NAD(P)/FAD-dependent oxidoreductase [Paenibacillus senegalensis]